MRLNHDCIRDILLYVEEYTTDRLPNIKVAEIINEFDNKYDDDMINYHIRQIDKAGLVDCVTYGDGIPLFIANLSWEGHSYADNIRDNKVWHKLKETSEQLASASLPVLIEKAPDIVKVFIR